MFSLGSSVFRTIYGPIAIARCYAGHSQAVLSRFSSTVSKSDIGFAFDIDGVLIKGSKPIPEATEALSYLSVNKIPFVLLTNGGGILESERVTYLNKLLQLQDHPINTNQIIQSHTPLRTLIAKHHRVLVVGGPGDRSREVAKHYGFKQVLRPIDIIRSNPSICPHHRYTEREIKEWGLPPEESKVSVGNANCNEPIDSIMIFNDPREMFSDLQIMLDLLNSEYGLLGTKRLANRSKPSIPIIFSNNDFYWANDFPLPRLGQGAVKLAVESLYSKMNDGMPLQSLTLGKPYKVSYDYAYHILIDWREKLLSGNTDSDVCLPELNDPPIKSPFKHVYMVGDNPESDILGGNDYGWNTILVRTGVYKDGDFVTNPALPQPNFGIVDNVKEAVKIALEKNGLY
ncbi:hypothetical protein FOA43_002153 [Brettanomyces nanus]|uniref:Uncharacterized protein n=1 Tax=Eeniella nana TaxID=13502 RepID=A0A875RUQ0_EENNA|nr:uncharacterized protein FOA43_002153 [Brettanomyces nanus]QPG74817.1 hypothetical protein FOA43_002153 [Brettanomyces nanus]